MCPVAERGREGNTPTPSQRWPRGSMKATLPLLIRSLQKEVDLPAFEPDTTQARTRARSDFYPMRYHLPISADGEVIAHRGEVRASSSSSPGWGPGSNAGESTSYWRERISSGNVAIIDPLGHLWLRIGVFPTLPLSATGSTHILYNYSSVFSPDTPTTSTVTSTSKVI